MMLKELALSIIFLSLIWLSSSLIINAVLQFSKTIKASPFVVSFFLLGCLTSVSEVSVAINSYLDQTLEISVGNLLGGFIVIFLLIIPILAVAGNGIKLSNRYSHSAMIVTIFSLVLPSIFFLDSYLLKREAVIILSFYGVSIFLLFFSHRNHKQKAVKRKLFKRIIFFELIKVAIGAALLLWACDNLINQILSFAGDLDISPFLISFLTLSIGTNLPEMSLAIKSVITNKKEISFGNYLGSATFNLVILSVLAIVNNRILVDANFISIIFFTVFGMGLFYYFILSKNDLSRKEGLVLLLVYISFLTIEIFVK